MHEYDYTYDVYIAVYDEKSTLNILREKNLNKLTIHLHKVLIEIFVNSSIILLLRDLNEKKKTLLKTRILKI